MQELVGRTIVIILLLFLAVILPFVVGDRFWETKMLGGIVKPHRKLIHENRPWWMGRVMMYISVALIFTVISCLALAVFSPLALQLSWDYYIILWVAVAIISLLAAVEDRPHAHHSLLD